MIKLELGRLREIIKGFDDNPELITDRYTYVNGDILEVFKNETNIYFK